MASRDAKDGGSAQCPKDAPALSLCGFGAPGRAAGTDLIDPRCGHRDTSDLVEVQSDTGHETVLIPKIWMIDCMLRNHDQVARRTGSGVEGYRKHAAAGVPDQVQQRAQRRLISDASIEHRRVGHLARGDLPQAGVDRLGHPLWQSPGHMHLEARHGATVTRDPSTHTTLGDDHPGDWTRAAPRWHSQGHARPP